MHRKRVVLGVAVAAAAATVLAACSSAGSSSTSANSSSSSGKVTLSWWNNANTQPLLGVFTNVIKQFEAAHPNVTIQNVPMQNELFKTKVTPALRGNSPPDIFQQWGSGQQATQVQSGKLADISSDVSPWIGSLGTPATEWQTNGKWYGVPYDLHVVGFWYRKDLFQQAGITARPPPSPSLSPTTPRCGRTASRRSRSGPRTAGRMPSGGSTSPSASAHSPPSRRPCRASA